MFDDANVGESVKKKLKACGHGVKIYPLAKIVNPEVIEVGDNTVIDDFTFVNGGKGIKLGRYIHLGLFTSIIGGGELIAGDYVVFSNGCRIITGTDTYRDGRRMSTSLPPEQRSQLNEIMRGGIIIEKDAFLGANVVVHPNVRIGEGAIVGSNSLVVRDVEPWTINVGNPCRVIGKRPKVTLKDI